ncbi:InlB B-repeat-containing protein [Clostridium tagluense]|uniref:InlB B-repeat-containing protein n=1 Tax=Clostridium tagluense TaxID=360422 RepID=UPI00299D8D31|nr:InlB B-repeat-containing protein [Clostridium tagluense]
MGYSAFKYCSRLTTIRFDSATTTIFDSSYTIPKATTIIGFDPSPAKIYADKYGQEFQLGGGIVSFNSNGGTNVLTQYVDNNVTAVKPTDPQKEGYTFEGWYTDVSFTNSFDFKNTPITSNTNLYAKWTLKSGLTVSVTALNGSISGNQGNHGYGDTVTLTQVPNENYKFESWMDGAGKILSTKAAYSFNITGNTSLKANFKEIAADVFTVEFISESGQVISVQQIPKNGSAIKPTDPSKPDCNFAEWSAAYTNVQSNLTLRPVYTAKTKTYILSVVEGSSIPNGITTYVFDTKVTVEANTPPAGQLFSHWTINEKIVSYDSTYSFYITGNTTVTAIYSDAEVVKTPTATIDPNPIANSTTQKISFIGQINVPTGYTMVECGVVAKQSATSLEDINFYTEGAIRAKSSAQTANGQYMMKKANVNSGEIWYARAYLSYKDGDGKVSTVYSDMASCTMP